MLSFHHGTYIPHSRGRSFSLFYIVSTLRTFVLSILGLFLPIYMFDMLKGMGYSQTTAYIMAAMAYLLLQTVYNILVFPASNIIAIWGMRICFIIGQICFFIFLFISRSTQSFDLLFASFALWGAAAAFWWIAYDTYFLDMSKEHHFGKTLGILTFLTILTGAAAPLAGGVVINITGYPGLFAVGGLSIFISIICLLFLKVTPHRHKVTLDDFSRLLKHHKRDFIALLGAGGEETLYSLAWPLLLHTILPDALSIGIFASLILLFSSIAAVIIGNVSDSAPRSKLKIGSMFVASSWVAKVIFRSSAGWFIIDIVYKTFLSLFRIPLDVIYYRHASKEEKMAYAVYREVALSTGNILGILTFIVVVWVGLPLWAVFMVAAIFAVFPLVLKETA